MPNSLQNICLWVDTTDFKTTGTRSIHPGDPRYSHKLKSAGRRWLTIVDGKSWCVFVCGPYLPGDNNGWIFTNWRQTLEEMFEGAGITGDSHFYPSAKFFTKIKVIVTEPPPVGVKKRKRGEIDPGLSPEDRECNCEIRKVRGLVEGQYRWMKQKYAALNNPFGENKNLHNMLVLFALGCHKKIKK